MRTPPLCSIGSELRRCRTRRRKRTHRHAHATHGTWRRARSSRPTRHRARIGCPTGTSRVLAHECEHGVAVPLGLHRPDARHRQEFGTGARPSGGDRVHGRVVEDHVGGRARRSTDAESPRERARQRVVGRRALPRVSSNVSRSRDRRLGHGRARARCAYARPLPQCRSSPRCAPSRSRVGCGRATDLDSAGRCDRRACDWQPSSGGARARPWSSPRGAGAALRRARSGPLRARSAPALVRAR